MAAFVEITERTRVAVVWFGAGDRSDLLGIVLRDTEEAPWRLVFRIRRYVDARAWESDDTKTGWTICGWDGSVGARDGLCTHMDQIMRIYADTEGPLLHVVREVLDGGLEAFQAFMSSQAFSHVREVRDGRMGDGDG